jgi:hypothetical protein
LAKFLLKGNQLQVRINWATMALAFLPLMAVGAVLIFAGLRADSRAMTDDGVMPLRTFLILLGAFFIGLNTLIGGGILLSAFLRNQRIQRLENTGLRGSAKVLQAHETGTYINNQPQVWMELQVELPGRDPLFVEKKMVVPYLQIDQVRPGAMVEVLMDPDRLGSARGVELILR